MKFFKALLEILLFFLGLALFYWVAKSVNLSKLFELLPQISLSIWPIFLFYPFMCALDVEAWRYALPSPWTGKVSYREMYFVRLAGEGINNITPILDVGGEPLKAILLSRRLGLDKAESVASCVIDRTSLFVAEIIFMIIGVLMAVFILPLPPAWQWGLSISILIFSSVAFLGIYAQKNGLFGSFFKWLQIFQMDTGLFNRFEIPFSKMDEIISKYYAKDSQSFKKSVFYHTLGWIAGGIEIKWMLDILGVHVSFFTGIVLEALLQLVRTASFFIPGNIGTQEAGLAFFVHLLNHDPVLGVGVSLLKRLRQIVWTGIGFGIWGIYQLITVYDRKLKH